MKRLCQRHQTILRLLSSAATASTRWWVRELYCPCTYGWSRELSLQRTLRHRQRPQQRDQTSWYVILAAVVSDIAETAHFAAFNYRAGKMTRAKASKHLSPQKQGYYLKEGTRLNTQKKAVFIFIKSKLHLCVSVGLCVCVCVCVYKLWNGILDLVRTATERVPWQYGPVLPRVCSMDPMGSATSSQVIRNTFL